MTAGSGKPVFSFGELVFSKNRFDERKNRFFIPFSAFDDGFGGSGATPVSSVFSGFEGHTSKNDLTESFVQSAESVVESDDADAQPDESVVESDSAFVESAESVVQSAESPVESAETFVESGKGRSAVDECPVGGGTGLVGTGKRRVVVAGPILLVNAGNSEGE